ncbi:MAG: hypothetical protein MZU91_02680 [Desulfosudis oleivorans]|nr:hypothetical protein [Desulfosudis oleivorans]
MAEAFEMSSMAWASGGIVRSRSGDAPGLHDEVMGKLYGLQDLEGPALRRPPRTGGRTRASGPCHRRPWPHSPRPSEVMP